MPGQHAQHGHGRKLRALRVARHQSDGQVQGRAHQLLRHQGRQRVLRDKGVAGVALPAQVLVGAFGNSLKFGHGVVG